MTAQDALKELKQIQDSGDLDTESDHLLADAILCRYLESIGQREIVEAYRDISKWYS